jgi:hypothetical protein
VHFLGINAHNSILHNWSMKKCIKMVWKIMLVVFGKISCLLWGMGRDFKDMCGKSQPQSDVYWFFNSRKLKTCLKNMIPGMVPWYDLSMLWSVFEKVRLMSLYTLFIYRTITKEVSWFREGNHQVWRGIQISIVICPWFFCMINIHPKMHCAQICHFFGLIYYIWAVLYSF